MHMQSRPLQLKRMRSTRFVRIIGIVAPFLLGNKAKAWTPPPTRGPSADHYRKCVSSSSPSSPMQSLDWQNTASRAVCGIALTLGIVFGNPSTFPNFLDASTNVASARVAPLADVGLREFLVKDGNTFLRLNLPTSLPTATAPSSSELGDTGREVQEAIELVRLRLEQVGFSGKTLVWNAALKEVRKARSLVNTPKMLTNIPETKQAMAKHLISVAETKLDELQQAVRTENIQSTLALQEECSLLVYNVRALSMPQGELPFDVPSEYETLPQLRGRALVECNLEKTNNNKPYRLPDGTTTNTITLTLTIDGYHTPITAGNFCDLVERKFYDGMSIQSAEELIIQTGNPQDNDDQQQQVNNGFIDPATRVKRVIPLELFYKNDIQPTYGYTSDEDMRATESMANPFQAYGALGMAHDPEDPNTASSQFWFLKWDQALVAPSRNTLDGSQACFGYVTKNQDLLSQVEPGDKITSMKIVQGAENLVANRNIVMPIE